MPAFEGNLLPSDLLERIADGEIEGQNAAAFGLGSRQRLIDEIQRAFSDARALWDAFMVRRERSQESATRLTRQAWVIPLLEILGFESLAPQRQQVQAGEQRYDISHLAGEAEGAPPVHIVAFGQDLDKRDGRRSPHASVQEYLNHSDALWGVATNGERLRLLRVHERFTRPAFIEFDLRGVFEGAQYAEFVRLYRLLHRSRFPADSAAGADCWLEQYFQRGLDEGGRVRDRLREGVERALEALGQGLLEAKGSKALREALVDEPTLSGADYYRQLLRLVYRLLFLMVAEERRLVFPEKEDAVEDDRAAVYRRYYSVSALRERCERHFAGDAHQNLWLGLLQTFRIFKDEAAAKTLGLAPLDSELFRDHACPDLEDASCGNEALLRAMFHLSTFLDDPDEGKGRRKRKGGLRAVRRRVNYGALDVEELGSVYEALLDLQPRITPPEHAGGVPTFRLIPSSERKQTGSYYTPPPLVQALVDSALEPVLEERLAGAGTRGEQAQALLELRVLDPAAGSGHFLLAAARRIAERLAQARAKGDAYSPQEYREALRDVIRHCLYAVDKNPLAVDLCKVALWIEGHDPGLPLSFLDHHVKCGDSLVGVDDLDRLDDGIPNEAYTAGRGDDKNAASGYRKRNAAEKKGQLALGHNPGPFPRWAADFETLAKLDERNSSEVQAKEGIYYEQLRQDADWWRYKTACDLWTYAFFAPLQREGADGLKSVPTTNDVRDALEGSAKPARLIGEAAGAAEQLRFFHWPLEFPDVFERGGFDVVLGNTPWERIKLQAKEFFTARDPAIANASNKDERDRLIAGLPESNPGLVDGWEAAQRDAKSTSHFVRNSGRFPLSGRGDVNTYAPFAELFKRFTHERGRAGVITPSGIATDYATRLLFRDFVNSSALVSLFDFENKEGTFADVHRSFRFCLLTLTGDARPAEAAVFACFLTDAEQIKEEERRVTLTPDDLALFNPNTRTAPTFRTRRDAAIARKFHERAGVLWREGRHGEDELNLWGVRFQRMFDMANDSNLFRKRESLMAEGWELEGNVFERDGERYLPLYEAKLFHQYDHRFATFEGADEDALRNGNARDLTADEKADPDSVIVPRYWVAESEVAKKLDSYGRTGMMGSPKSQVPSPKSQVPSPKSQVPSPKSQRLSLGIGWLIALRGIARATDKRTTIAAVVPNYALSGTARVIGVGSLPSAASRTQLTAAQRSSRSPKPPQ